MSCIPACWHKIIFLEIIMNNIYKFDDNIYTLPSGSVAQTQCNRWAVFLTLRISMTNETPAYFITHMVSEYAEK